MFLHHIHSSKYPLFFYVTDQVRASGGRVLVHCQAGVSRSATITLAYLMLHSKLSLHEAFALVKSRRCIVSPNFNFMGQLYSLEQALEKGEEERKLEPALDTSIPNDAVPQTPVPQITVPQTPVPQTPVPQTPMQLPKSVSMTSGFKFR